MKLPKYRKDGYPLGNRYFNQQARKAAKRLKRIAKRVEEYLRAMEKSLELKTIGKVKGKRK